MSDSSKAAEERISVQISYRGKVFELPFDEVNPQTTTGVELHSLVKHALGLSNSNVQLKLLLKGKRIDLESMEPVLNDPKLMIGNKKKVIKIMAIASSSASITNVQNQKSDPTIRGFDDELKREQERRNQMSTTPATVWGLISSSQQDRQYKFVKLEVCTWQSFGHRASDTDTPHAFEARKLLEKLSTDPGIVAVMRNRELVVNTLGEMDPIDDRIMKQHQSSSNNQSCLLGYNTNHGLRIDLKLRNDNLKGFRPYSQLVGTLLHELSHNWVGEHDVLFWSNFADMRIEYLYKHASLRNTLVQGKTTADIAGLSPAALTFDNIYNLVMSELVSEMGQHGLHPQMIQTVITEKIKELEQQQQTTTLSKQRLGDGENQSRTTEGHNNHSGNRSHNNTDNLRERALAAAEQRAAAAKAQKKNVDDAQNDNTSTNNTQNKDQTNRQ